MTDTPIMKPVDAGILRRVIDGFKYATLGRIPPATYVSGNPTGLPQLPNADQMPGNSIMVRQGEQEWFGPSNPPLPIAPPDVAGRQMDYPVGYNLAQQPRYGYAVSFEQLRTLADSYDLLRLVIETRKDQISKLTWSIQPKQPHDAPIRPKADQRCHDLTKFFLNPDKEHNWDTWLRAIIEDMLVIDAVTVYPRAAMDGSLYAFELIDGSTIKRVLADDGRTPLPPEPAYQQILKGVPAVDYTLDDLVYFPRNVRTHKVYGYSPVEQIIMTVNIALRRQVFQLNWYTEGNVPEALIGVPATWTPEQIAQFQKYWDSLMQGNLAARRHAKFVPGDMNVQFTRGQDGGLKDEFDEWLARIICYCFSMPPLPFVREQNRATAQTAHKAALEEGLAPIMQYIKALIDLLIVKYYGYTDVEFVWDDYEKLKQVEQAQLNEVLMKNGVISLDAWRAERGEEPLGMKEAIWGIGPLGIIFVEDLIDPVKRQQLMGMMAGMPTDPLAGNPALGIAPGEDPIDKVPDDVLAEVGLTRDGVKSAREHITPEVIEAAQAADVAPEAIDALREAEGVPRKLTPQAITPTKPTAPSAATGDLKDPKTVESLIQSAMQIGMKKVAPVGKKARPGELQQVLKKAQQMRQGGEQLYEEWLDGLGRGGKL